MADANESLLGNMSDHGWSDFQPIKRSKTGRGFAELCASPQGKKLKGKRGLFLSLKSTRLKNNRSLREFLEPRVEKVDSKIYGKDQSGFCPVCQVPFTGLVGLSSQGHVQECLENRTESSEQCPEDVSCNSISPWHFKKFSHQQLAKSRSNSIKDVNGPINQEEVKMQSKEYSKEIMNYECKSQDKVISGCEKDNFLKNAESLTTVNNDLNQCQASTCSLFFKTTDSCGAGGKVSMSENMEDIMGTAVELPVKENLVDHECPDEISQWLNDDFTYEDFELNDVACTSSTNDSDTNCSSNVSTSSQDTRSSTNSLSNNCVNFGKSMETNLFKGNKKQTLNNTNMKQMDIGVFFGLKPKKDALPDNGKTIRISTNSTENFQKTNLTSTEKESQHSKNSQNRKCPFYKIVDGTSFAVDAFSYGSIPGISVYFLSHFHYDHYGGLNRTFSNPIYCSQITANLILLKIKVVSRFIHPLPLNKPINIQDVEVTLLEANHCPGAVMFIFKLLNGKTHLHTGDFRASPLMEENPFLLHCSIHTLYLDTTYCDPDYNFPPQSDTIDYCVSLVNATVAKNSKTLIVVGAYTIGKEKIFSAVADALQCKVGVRRDKYNVLQCLECQHLKGIITQNYKDAQVHVLPIGDLTHKRLALHLKDYNSRFSEILAIKPTGWTFTDSCDSSLTNIKPSKRGAVTIYGVPYSEHSSYNELEQFVKFIKPYKIIPTVNNGSATKRDDMNKLFRTWLKK